MTMSQKQTLKLAIDLSSPILNFSSLVVKSCSLDMRTLEVPSYIVWIDSQASFVLKQVLISLKIFLSTPLEMELSS